MRHFRYCVVNFKAEPDVASTTMAPQKRDFILIVFIYAVLLLPSQVECAREKPNIVIFLADDMGYGDLQSFGNPLSHTPNIDRILQGGLKLTQAYSASSICSPARASLLTGRYPPRTGVWDEVTSVFLQKSIGGLPHSEITIPEMLAPQGYKSALVGKWHLGVGRQKEFLPLEHGFDRFLGFPYSHQNCPCETCFYPDGDCDSEYCKTDNAPCPLVLNNTIIEQPADMITLADRQAKAARSWIIDYSLSDTPFFLLYSFMHPHYPQFAGKRFRNSTIGGAYTDSLAEMDWQVGEVMDQLEKSGIIENTFVLFTSDNGPDVKLEGGFSGIFRCGKTSTFEGGFRVPTIAYWPGHIPTGVSTQLVSHLDIWPTLRRLSGSSPDEFDVTLDGFDISEVLFSNGNTTRSSMLYYDITPDPDIGPFAVRSNRYKAHFYAECTFMCDPDAIDEMCRAEFPITSLQSPLLFDILKDPKERVDLGKLSAYKTVVENLTMLMETESKKIVFAESVLKKTDSSYALCCKEDCEPFPYCCNCESTYSDNLFPVNNYNLRELSIKTHNCKTFT
ncbi:arylsulfatase A-like isoform X2 [Anneissia japonica]|uniref:arylsulfatase A-like isoform X2 n=1 Tax=Anneissia japonica TaxID=1529436 RepID=UPI0014259386|nr:arylsulfatase A-like isoform X2 [Anneissia japonica]XP_033110797.1 arylsulfatase A-like isoform X2 [Anneissia japonica]